MPPCLLNTNREEGSLVELVGPSSSHTVGPMRAGKIFINDLWDHGLLDKVSSVQVRLF